MKASKSDKLTNSYPKLMQNHLGTVILFLGRKTGIVLHPGGNNHLNLGGYANDWDQNQYSDFHGTITLEND